MTKIDIFSGFLGAGKTTLIKKLIKEAYAGEKLVLIENEFGEIGVDGGFLKEAGIEITEMSQGCICCSLVGDFAEALKKVMAQYNPDRILIEPSGVGKLSDVIAAVKNIDSEDIELNSFTTVVDVKKCKMYMKNFGEFFNNQIEHANAIILSRTADAKPEKIKECLDLIKERNANAVIVTTDWDELEGTIIKAAMERQNTLEAQLEKLTHEHDEVCPCCGGHHHHEHHHHHDEECECGHEHHHHHHDEECECGHEHHHHHHDEGCECGHEHHHHHHDEECECGHEHHHHHHDEECECGHEHHHHHHDEECECGHEHHHHHHADEIFQSVGAETAKKFTAKEIEEALNKLEDEEAFGAVLRAKGIVASENGKWIHFDYVPGELDIREGGADIIGRICVIGANIKEAALKELFGV